MSEQKLLPEDVIRKIQKLLALGKRGGTEAEANAAMDMAQELLAKYNLDLAVVENSAVAGGTVQVKEKREQTKIDRSAMYKWQKDLMNALADANFCWTWITLVDEPRPCDKEIGRHRWVKRQMILGREANVVAVQFMYSYLADTMEDLLPYANSERASRSAMSWKEGCVARLTQRIWRKAQELRKSEETTSTGEKMGLVLRSLVQQEYQANWDARLGEGSWARYQAQEAERKAKAVDVFVAPEPVETEKEKAKREKREKAQRERWERESQRAFDRRDHDAFAAGHEVGSKISLQDRIVK